MKRDDDCKGMDDKSKTQKKKEALALQDLGEKLVKLSAEQTKEMKLPEELHNAVSFARTIKSRGALKRQMQFIGTLMRKIDNSPVREAIENIEEGNYKKALKFKETENWREELIAGDRVLLEDILNKYPEADRQKLNQLIRNAVKERENEKSPKASRVLFRYLSEIRSE